MWTPTDRAWVGDFGSGQALSDDQYRLIEPFIPPAKPGGRPRTTDMRRMLDGLFYVVRTGCQWRHLPPPPAFPPWQTIYGYFRLFLTTGVWETIRHSLVTTLRESEGREASPSAVILDTQSVKTTEKRASRLRCCQESQGTQAPCRGRYPGLAAGRHRPCRRSPGRRQRLGFIEAGQAPLLLAQGRVRRQHLRPHRRPDRLLPARPDADHRPAHRRDHRLRRAAQAMDRGKNARLARPMPPSVQGL